MNEEVRFDEEERLRYRYPQTPRDSALVRTVLKLGLASTREDAFQALLYIAIGSALLTLGFWFFGGRGGTIRATSEEIKAHWPGSVPTGNAPASQPFRNP